MAGIFDAPEARIDAILHAARGGDGALGPVAVGFALPAGVFTRNLQAAPLADPQEPSAGYDRRYEQTWTTVRREPLGGNPRDQKALRICRLVLRVGYIHGVGFEAFVLPYGAETAAEMVKHAVRRAAADADWIEGALTWPDLWSGTDINPAIVDMVREGDSAIAEAGPGRLVAATTYAVRLQVTQGAGHATP